MPPHFLDVDPEAVAAAGSRTAATAGDWSAWAVRVETLLRDVAAGAADAVVTGDVEAHVSTLNPRLHRLAADAEALGINATSAAHVIVNIDLTAADALRSNGSCLLRPVNGPAAGPGPRAAGDPGSGGW